MRKAIAQLSQRSNTILLVGMLMTLIVMGAGLSQASTHTFTDAKFFSFNQDVVGSWEITDSERHIRFLTMDAATITLQNQYSGDARVACLSGVTDFDSVTDYDPALVTEQFPPCMQISTQPGDVSIWKLPNGDVYKFQMLSFTISEMGPDMYESSGSFQVAQINLPLPGYEFSNSQFYSFSQDVVGSWEIAEAERNIRFMTLGPFTVRLQNQVSGNASVLCLAGDTDYDAITEYDPDLVIEQFPTCLDIDAQPSDVIIWELPNGDLYKFQLLSFTITEMGPDMYEVEGRFLADPIDPVQVANESMTWGGLKAAYR